MLSKANHELRAHYGYYVGLFVLEILFLLVVQFVLGKFLFDSFGLEKFMTMSSNEVSFSVPTDVFFELVGEASGISLLSIFLSFFLTTLLTILVLRSIFQKINHPDLSFTDSALFKTNPGHAILLPFKLLLANLFVILIVFLLWFVIFMIFKGAQSVSDLSIIPIIMFLFMLVIGVVTSPISYLVAYDEERRYNFWTSFTKGVSIGIKHFWRILKTMIGSMLIMFLFTFLSSLIIGFFANPNSLNSFGIIGLVVMLIFFLWVLPLMTLYMVVTMDHIIAQEY